jgi:hypothetical protein
MRDVVADREALLEYAKFGYLIDTSTEEGKADLMKAQKLWKEIMDAKDEDIDYDVMVERIKALRAKYERD